MAYSWSAENYAQTPDAEVGASETNRVVSRNWAVSSDGALNCVIAIDCEDVTDTTEITAKLQTAIGDVWEDSKTVTITANDRYYIKLNIEVAGDQTYLPLLNECRLVVTTGTGDAVTVTGVYVLQST
jgi:hypothetical protein